MKRLIVIVPVITLFLLCTSCNKENDIGKFVSSPSPIEVPEELIENGKFSYGYMTVPEFHNNPEGKVIELAIAIFKSHSDSATHEPLVVNTGGPGLSNIDNFLPDFFGELGDLFLDNRDIVIIELRGLKYSRPNLFLPELDHAKLYQTGINLSAEETIELYLDSLEVAYNRFEREDVNLSAYNDYEIANDIVFVMDKLGYDKFSIFGSSFGTLLAQHVLLNSPEKLVSVTMNAVVDINRAFPAMHRNSINALESIFEQFENDPKLNKAYPDLKNRFLARLKDLNENPVILNIPYGKNGDIYETVLNGNKLSVWVFGQMYWDTQLPKTLHNILNEDYNQIVNNPGILFPMEGFSDGLSLSILLAEYSNVEDKDIPLDNEYIDFVKGTGTMIFSPTFLKQAKSEWRVIDRQKKNINVVSDVPTLMFVGEMDHLLPEAYAKDLSKNLRNSYLYIFPGVAHSPIDTGPCGILMMKEFIDNPTKAPDSSCLSEYQQKL